MENSNWDNRWMELAQVISSWSKDRSRKTSAVIIDDRNVLVSIGWNGFPREINDDVNDRHERPSKYFWTEHAERNAIFNAAANGYKLRGCKMYLPWFPCADCARAIIQSGISSIVCVEPDWNDPNWAKDFSIVKIMLDEARVSIKFFTGISAPELCC